MIRIKDTLSHGPGKETHKSTVPRDSSFCTVDHFLVGPLMAAIILTGAWKVAQDFQIGFVLHTLFFISAPAMVASIHSMLFIERYLPSWHGSVLPHHGVVRVIVFFITSLCWTAFLSLPFWSRFRIGSLSALKTEIIIVVIAIVITFVAIGFM